MNMRVLLCAFGLLAACGASASDAAAIRHRTDERTTDLSAGLFDPAEKIVQIGGKEVRVVLSVQTALLRIVDTGPGPRQTSVTVTINTTDASTLPEGLTVTRLRLQRVASPHRVYHAELTQRPRIPEPIGYDEFGSDDPLNLVTGTRFRAALRLELDGDVQIVPMGMIRVIPPFITLNNSASAGE